MNGNVSNLGGSAATTSPAQNNTSTQKSADAKDANDFSKAVEKKGASKKETKEELLDKSPMDLVRGLNDTSTSTRIANAAAVQQSNAADNVDKVNEIVNRIMVAEAQNTKEVKVSFNQDFLAGTEMTIRKEDGFINIEFNTVSADSFDFLNKGERALMQQLQNKLGDEVSVSINLQDSNSADQQQDGRSRNEFVGEEDQDET